jgi:hypothetical protein
VKKLSEAIVGGVKTRLIEGEYSTEKDGKLGDVRIDASDGQVLSMSLGEFLEIRLEPEELAKDFGYSQDLFASGVWKINRRIGDPDKIERLVIECDAEVASILKTGARQEVILDQKRGKTRIRLGKGFGEAPKATTEEIEKNLLETVAFPKEHPVIRRLAKIGIGDADTNEDKIARLVKFVSNHIEDDYTAEPLSVLDLVKVRRGDCTEHSLLFATLSRAVGIPCRQVTGLVYMGDDVKSFGGHAWNEVVLDGRWVPVDSMWDETEINPTHISFGHRAEVELARLGFQGQKVKLIRVEKKKRTRKSGK